MWRAASWRWGSRCRSRVPAVDVNAVLVGPRGRAVSITRSEDKLLVGDPLLTANLGWKNGNWYLRVRPC